MYQTKKILIKRPTARKPKRKRIFVCSPKTIYIKNSKTVSTSNTLPERLFEQQLVRSNIEYKKQYKFKGFYFDFYLSKKRLLVEIDGDYWHGNPQLYSVLSEMQTKNKLNDITKNRVAMKSGIALVRIWEYDIMNNTDKYRETLDRIGV